MFSPLALLALSGLASAIPAISARGPYPRATCDQSANNVTKESYTILYDDDIFTISNKTGVGACDIARYNKLADAYSLTPGFDILIPEQICEPDNTSCLLEDDEPLSDCVIGGPHTYTTIANDTIAKVALTKFHVTIDSLTSQISDEAGSFRNAWTVLTTGTTLKIPQCAPSQCIIQPYHFTYGTYKDLAAEVGATVGQLYAFNPTYNISISGPGTGPILTIPFNCTLLSSNYTVES